MSGMGFRVVDRAFGVHLPWMLHRKDLLRIKFAVRVVVSNTSPDLQFGRLACLKS